ncbi:MAG: S-adenosylmethionine:tRNA ribosyltransferase-isomerase [Cytophagales bacterium]|nr:MAG: S-adenosylmethionine:tRNA ribosyltransferase-isomerase [Cytophagales bacterium]
MDIHQIALSDYQYHLPDDRIARFPLKKRDDSKLLLYKAGQINNTHFYDLATQLEEDYLLMFNNTKVIPARFYFQKETGAVIEILLLQPIIPYEIEQAMQNTHSTTWRCMIGNKKKWKNGCLTRKIDDITIEAHYTDEENVLLFTWSKEVHFAQLLEKMGEIPLPPYMQREATEADKQTYQTVYAKKEGAVAAPTAGLHFTENVLNDLKHKNIATDFLTLHVGAGTFQPIKAEKVFGHVMHSEQIVFSWQNLQNIEKHYPNIVAVGTTAMRTLETIYWLGVKIIKGEYDAIIKKEYPYTFTPIELPTPKESLRALMVYMQTEKMTQITTNTEIFILPSYTFRFCKGIITNFHQPASTLILLIAAFVGNDWRRIYEYALENDFRFLSYGDSSLLWSNHFFSE